MTHDSVRVWERTSEAGEFLVRYCVVQVNSVFNMPQQLGGQRWVAYPHRFIGAGGSGYT